MDAAPPTVTPPAPATSAARTSKRVIVVDRLAGFVVRGGGLLVIAAVLGILVFLVVTVLPLFGSARVEPRAVARVPVTAPVRLLATDEHRLLVAALGTAPETVWYRPESGEVIARHPIAGFEKAHVVAAQRTVRSDEAAVAFDDGRVAFLELGFDSTYVVGPKATALRERAPKGSVAPYEGGVVQRNGNTFLHVVPRQRLRGTVALPAESSRARCVSYASHDGAGAAVAVTEDGRIHLVRETVTTPPVGEAQHEFALAPIASKGPRPPDDLFACFVDEDARTAWCVGRAGGIARIDVAADPAIRREVRQSEAGSSTAGLVSAAGLVIGGHSLAVAYESGVLAIWSRVRVEGTAPPPESVDDGFVLRVLHRFEPFPSPIRSITASAARRLLYLGHDDGSISLAYTVNERVLATARAEPALGPVTTLCAGSRDDGCLAVARAGDTAGFEVSCPHPEANARALFAPIHYEGYPAPALVYQSSSASDEAEPKLCLTPLLYGTLKGTFYAMAFALPLALLAALYTSQFTHPRVRAVVKPSVELMASLPSVVLGFVAYLVIAPTLADVVPAALTAAIAVPVGAFAAGALWHVLPLKVRHGTPPSARILLAVGLAGGLIGACVLGNGVIQRTLFSGPANPDGDFKRWLLAGPGSGSGTPVLALALFGLGATVGLFVMPRLWTPGALPRGVLGGAARVFAWFVLPGAALALLAEPIESVVFGGDFRRSLLGPDGETYVQTNSLVVGIAMGFAVIPIVYTIAEDALSAIPESLKSAALACGASPWQTATRVVVPAAAPGIFSAAMVGLGRAVGETMIILMAAGGTAILEASPFNGFRTLSANVATELPEAPQGGTLYRVLFFAALMLFALTFVLNTVAEAVRLRFRKKYKRL
jgi:phosphate transport system permease protein